MGLGDSRGGLGDEGWGVLGMGRELSGQACTMPQGSFGPGPYCAPRVFRDSLGPWVTWSVS